jgi:hypothetical protein
VADQPLSGKATVSTLTDDDKIALIDAPGSTAAVRLILATDARTYMQNGVQLTSQKGAANGYAPLDATSKVPSANLPTLASGVASVNGLTGVVTGLEQTSQKNIANGYAGLDASALIPVARMPVDVQTASRSFATNVAEGQVVDFAFAQNIFQLTSSPTMSVRNAAVGRRTRAIFIQDSTGYHFLNWPGTNFSWEGGLEGVISAYPTDVSVVDLEVREDGVTVLAFGRNYNKSNQHRLATGDQTYDRMYHLAAGLASGGIPTGTARVTYFTPEKKLTVNTLTSYSSTTAAVGGTHGWMAVAAVDPSTGQLSVQAVTADTTTLWSATNTAYSIGTTSSMVLEPGRRYAFLHSWSGSGATPLVASTRDSGSPNAILQIAPRMCGSMTGMSTPPAVGATYADASIATYSALFWGMMT